MSTTKDKNKYSDAAPVAVLGIHALSHDSGACLITPGGITAISEERLSRTKHEGRFPDASIEYVLKAAGLSGPEEITHVYYDHLNRKSEEVRRELEARGFGGKSFAIRHHDAHAASAFFVSPFDDAGILVVDGGGSWGDETNPGEPAHYLHGAAEGTHELQTLWRGTGTKLTLIRRTVATPSHRMGVGFFYAYACMHLGFGDLEGGKLMGLAAYGGQKPIFTKPIFTECDGEWLAEADRDFYLPENWPYYGKKYFRAVPPRLKSDPILNKHAEIAHYTQSETERAMVAMAAALHTGVRSENLCLAGGVALNSVANRKIMDGTDFKSAFIQPGSNDSGIPLGCALYGYHVALGAPRGFRMETAFLGRGYSDGEIEAALKDITGCEVSRPADILEQTAAAIDDGKVAGWFEGGAEIGPRALGHRSILADPRRAEMWDYLNREVKHREPYRPYAPAVLLEYAGEYFDPADDSPFMLLTATVKPERRAHIPAVTHVDGTSRLQTLTKKRNGRFYDLVAAFHRRTRVPMVLNTSFNLAGDPIVESPADAVKCFLNTKIDLLILEDFLVRKK